VGIPNAIHLGNVLCFLEVGQAISCKLNVSQYSPASMSWTDGEMALA
jgi:hypothetical protein